MILIIGPIQIILVYDSTITIDIIHIQGTTMAGTITSIMEATTRATAFQRDETTTHTPITNITIQAPTMTMVALITMAATTHIDQVITINTTAEARSPRMDSPTMPARPYKLMAMVMAHLISARRR